MKRFTLLVPPALALGLVLGLVVLTEWGKELPQATAVVMLAVAFAACLYAMVIAWDLGRQRERVGNLRRENIVLESQCRFYLTDGKRKEVRLEVLTAISEVARVASSGSTFEEMITGVLELLQPMLQCDEMVLYAVDEDNLPVAKVRKTPDDIEFLKEGKPEFDAYSPASPAEEQIVHDCVERRDVCRTCQGDSLEVAVPLVADGGLLGALKVTLALDGSPAERASTTERHEALLQELSRHLGLALKKTKLEDLSTIDPLTGLFNKRQFDKAIEEHFARRRRRQRAMALVMIDIDHFKQVNDTYGHRAGDAVLAEMGNIVKSSFRKTDTAFRYGGEELAVLLGSTALTKASQLAERLRAKVARHRFPLADGGTMKLTISLGVAAVDSTCTEGAALVEHADRALYRAKRSGRDTVCVFSGTTEEGSTKPEQEQ